MRITLKGTKDVPCSRKLPCLEGILVESLEDVYKTIVVPLFEPLISTHPSDFEKDPLGWLLDAKRAPEDIIDLTVDVEDANRSESPVLGRDFFVFNENDFRTPHASSVNQEAVATMPMASHPPTTVDPPTSTRSMSFKQSQRAPNQHSKNIPDLSSTRQPIRQQYHDSHYATANGVQNHHPNFSIASAAPNQIDPATQPWRYRTLQQTAPYSFGPHSQQIKSMLQLDCRDSNQQPIRKLQPTPTHQQFASESPYIQNPITTSSHIPWDFNGINHSIYQSLHRPPQQSQYSFDPQQMICLQRPNYGANYPQPPQQLGNSVVHPTPTPLHPSTYARYLGLYEQIALQNQDNYNVNRYDPNLQDFSQWNQHLCGQY